VFARFLVIRVVMVIGRPDHSPAALCFASTPEALGSEEVLGVVVIQFTMIVIFHE